MNGNFDLLDLQVGGRKGKTCSMAGCQNTHQRCPSLSFFRFPKEISRAKEWLMICDRPDLMRRVDLGEINVNNYYVCETHFPNQILDYATRKILIKTALPLSMAETKLLPFSAELMMNALSGLANQNVNKNAIDGFGGNNGNDDDDDDDYDDVENDNASEGYPSTLIPQVIISKTEGNYQHDTYPMPDEENFLDDPVSRNQLYWTPDATRYLIKLRAEREADFEQSGARKSLLWVEISDKMRSSGYDFSPEKVSKKWHNIMITYNKNAEKKNGPVNWEFFEDIDTIYKHRRVQDLNSVVDEAHRLVNTVPLERLTALHTKTNGCENGPTKRKKGIDARSTPPHFEALNGHRQSTFEYKKFKLNVDHDMRMSDATDTPPGIPSSIDENWWKEYFERKLELEREKIRKQDERHKDQMNFQKMAIMLQEKVEKIKVDAIHGLTNALIRLQESKKL